MRKDSNKLNANGSIPARLAAVLVAFASTIALVVLPQAAQGGRQGRR